MKSPLFKILFFPISILLILFYAGLVVVGYTGDWAYTLRGRLIGTRQR